MGCRVSETLPARQRRTAHHVRGLRGLRGWLLGCGWHGRRGWPLRATLCATVLLGLNAHAHAHAQAVSAAPELPLEPEKSAGPAPGADAVVDGPARRWGAALGVVATQAPEYTGSSRRTLSWEPGFALRWGRFSFASRSAFAVRSSDPGARGGLRVELARSDRWRAGLGLRQDSGRDASSSPLLAGLGDVRGTLRARLSASYAMDPGWRIGAAWMVDVLGRGTGQLGDLSVGRDLRLTPDTAVNAGVAIGLADRRWMQNWFGVTPEQAARSGYPAYRPRAGLRELGVSLGGRTELDEHWAVFYSVGASQLLGGAADSPFTVETRSWNARAGLVYRF